MKMLEIIMYLWINVKDIFFLIFNLSNRKHDIFKSISFIVIYFKNRETKWEQETERGLSSTGSHPKWLQHPGLCLAETRIPKPSGSPTWVGQTQVPRPLSAASPGTLPAGLRPTLWYEMRKTKQGVNLLHHNADPK